MRRVLWVGPARSEGVSGVSTASRLFEGWWEGGLRGFFGGKKVTASWEGSRSSVALTLCSRPPVSMVTGQEESVRGPGRSTEGEVSSVLRPFVVLRRLLVEVGPEKTTDEEAAPETTTE